MIKPVVAASVLMMVALWPAWADDSAEIQATTSIADMMNRIVRPASDAVFYVASEAPADDAAWSDLENKALMLAESANLLLMPGYVGDSERWSQDVKLMKDAALAAFEAAKKRDVPLLEELGNTLYESCEGCHMATR